jgi:tetratricopeptide (TPR) repeat protein
MKWIRHLREKAKAYGLCRSAKRLIDASKFEEAIRELDEAIQLDPHNAWAFANRGVALRLSGRIDEAIASLERSIDLGGGGHLHLCFVNRALCYKALGNIDWAMADLTKAKQVAPRATEANLERSFLFFLKKDFMSYLTDIQNGCVIERGTKNWHLDFQYDLYHCPRDGPIEQATQEILVDPLSAAGYLKRAERCRQAGRIEKAADDLNEALRLAPGRADNLRALESLPRTSGPTES